MKSVLELTVQPPHDGARTLLCGALRMKVRPETTSPAILDGYTQTDGSRGGDRFMTRDLAMFVVGANGELAPLSVVARAIPFTMDES
jgi:hypothetical protein